MYFSNYTCYDVYATNDSFEAFAILMYNIV